MSDPKQRILQLALSGESVVDWSSFHVSSLEEADHFLRINEYDWNQQKDRDRLLGIHNEAVGYMKGPLQMELPPELFPADLRQLFLLASQSSEPKLQKLACSLLKTMNIINHINGRELLFHCPISTRDLYSLVEDKIERELSNLARKVFPGIRYQGGRKQKESLMTKLLAKRETIAAQINDRVRYRIVTPRREEIEPVLLQLFDTVLPFNYVIPDASTNDLLQSGLQNSLRRRLDRLQRKDYTGQSYRIVKFAVDIPVRLDRFLSGAPRALQSESFGSIGYVIVEFQIVDEATDRNNNTGENAHALYKQRQLAGVKRRLIGG